MKNILLLMFMVVWSAGDGLAQVHLKGQRFVEVQAGLTDRLRWQQNQVAINGFISTGRYNRQYNAWRLTFSYSQQTLQTATSLQLATTRQFAIGYGYEFNLWRNAVRTRFVRGSIQPIVLYESVSPTMQTQGGDSLRIAPTDQSKYLLGVDAGIDVEFTPVVISIRQRWQPTSSFQPFHTLFSIGWRFHK